MVERMKFSLITILISNLFVMTAAIHSAVMVKLKASAVVALFVAPSIYILEGLNIWAIQNQTYIAIVLSAIIIDHLLGSIRHSRFFDNDWSMLENIKGFFTKLTLVVMIGILFEELHHLAGDYQFITNYTITIARLTVFLYPFGSAIGNSRRISGGKFPPDRWFNQIHGILDSWVTKNKDNGKN